MTVTCLTCISKQPRELNTTADGVIFCAVEQRWRMVGHARNCKRYEDAGKEKGGIDFNPKTVYTVRA